MMSMNLHFRHATLEAVGEFLSTFSQRESDADLERPSWQLQNADTSFFDLQLWNFRDMYEGDQEESQEIIAALGYARTVC